ncbi:MAG: response regulator [Defluviitaleaceae bacterium]|nr:response regulator [Defluviitaleaceae bacterium]
MKTIFVVDDNPVNLFAAKEVLSDQYKVITLSSASIMFEFLNNFLPDLILLDILMPEMDGFGALRRLRADKRYAKIPVIFLTSKNDAETEVLGFEMGVVDFISKPFSGPVLLNRIKSHLHIESIIHKRTEKLLRLQNGITSVLANMVEHRDKLTGNHIERTAAYLKILLDTMYEKKIYYNDLRDWDVDIMISAARLHDLGKIAVSDMILNKREKLTEDEFNTIKTHTSEGEKIIEGIIRETGDEDFLDSAKLFAGYHHERWDGLGYPRGLKGMDIPLQGRVMAIADVYDALVSDRPYKKAFTHEEAVEIIRDGRGTQFDPVIVDIFVEINELFQMVAISR